MQIVMHWLVRHSELPRLPLKKARILVDNSDALMATPLETLRRNCQTLLGVAGLKAGHVRPSPPLPTWPRRAV